MTRMAVGGEGTWQGKGWSIHSCKVLHDTVYSHPSRTAEMAVVDVACLITAHEPFLNYPARAQGKHLIPVCISWPTSTQWAVVLTPLSTLLTAWHDTTHNMTQPRWSIGCPLYLFWCGIWCMCDSVGLLTDSQAFAPAWFSVPAPLTLINWGAFTACSQLQGFTEF